MNNFESMVETLNQLLESNKESWLLGAGISCDANIPLMDSLTKRVKTILTEADIGKNKKIYESLGANLDTTAHIEHYLSHLGDLIALAERSKDKCSSINGETYSIFILNQLLSYIELAPGQFAQLSIGQQIFGG